MRPRRRLPAASMLKSCYLAFGERAWGRCEEVPEPVAGLLADEFPETPLDQEVTMAGRWRIEPQPEGPTKWIRGSVFKLDLVAGRLEELMDALGSLPMPAAKRRALNFVAVVFEGEEPIRARARELELH